MFTMVVSLGIRGLSHWSLSDGNEDGPLIII